MDINQLIARRVQALRAARGLSLAALAELSGVSRSNISLIERGESSATATVLDKLAGALGVTLASLFEAESAAPSPLSTRERQPVWTDPASGYTRRQLSPGVRSPMQLVEVEFPPGRRVSYEQGHNEADIYQQLWLLEGTLEVTVGTQHWRLQPGDCLAFREVADISYENPGQVAARYLVSLVNLPFSPV
ncbi:helix-turn-helix domain-containing protein [Duganella sp. FT80W]|uniref:Helix-turn-helix domain-containing protein n=1 Tax=Duganella guangzhouensis TaxID=2666084 RepID=A0A6I2KZG9_9BURK|nr:XRE family transcriptional regulator [Duganella guangzhouensis]MRW91328.1 helix-turn-helix domain-containing protein [Duganella guangzhouensis]